jgi:galactokinase
MLPKPPNYRARHVVTENKRVLEVLQGVTPERFGELMNASHTSLRDDYEVSIPALDTLVEILQKTPGVFGAKLTGAGFGGACVALVALGEEKIIVPPVLKQYNNAGYAGQILVPNFEVSDQV